ncbi:MAG: nitroreductase family protein [Deltaproteobacteria bacterium]|nr:nitroreductase family protein [Candidatus Deferrimicrobiaceae bacterium]
MEFRRILAGRRSLRAFADRPVEPEKIGQMIEAARWSPSCGNRQPWRFTVVARDDPRRPALEGALTRGNAWAKKAPVLIVSGARREDGSVVESREYYLHDTGLATMSLLYRGVDQGLLVHPMAGWKEAPLKEALSMPEDFRPIAVIAVGYPGNTGDLDEETRKKDETPRTRKEIGEVAYLGGFGEPFRAALPAAPAKRYEIDIPLRFRDIDSMGHVNNAVTLTLLEYGRIRFYFDLFGARRVDEIPFILAEANVRYRIPILLQDPVRLRMHVTDVARSSFRFQYELSDPHDGRIYTEAETVQVMYDYAAGRPRPIDASFLEKIREFIGG